MLPFVLCSQFDLPHRLCDGPPTIGPDRIDLYRCSRKINRPSDWIVANGNLLCKRPYQEGLPSWEKPGRGDARADRILAKAQSGLLGGG